MEKEQKFFEKFKDKDRTSKEQPSPMAWDKLSQKLDDAQANQPKIVSMRSNYRWFGIAAGLIILIGAIGIINRGMQDSFANEAMAMKTAEPMEIEDLKYSKPSGFYALAIHTSQYYNVSPSKLADNDNSNDSAKTRLQLRNRTTRQARQPEYLASNESQVSDLSNENADMSSSTRNVEFIEKRVAQIESSAADSRNSKFAKAEKEVYTEGKRAASYAKAKIENEVYQLESNGDDYTQLDAADNEIALSSKDLSTLELDQFNWLVGNWTANYEVNKVNHQEWKKKDAFTLAGSAVLTINGESIPVEKMEIKKVGDSFYFIRVNTKDGSTIEYKLKSLRSNTVVFENAELKDQIIFQQNSPDNFNNLLIPQSSLQMNQFPGANQSNVEFKRNKNK